VKLRVGPWSPFASAYLFIVTLTLAYNVMWWRQQAQEEYGDQISLSITPLWWYYNVAGFLWMMYISYTVIVGPAGFYAWATFSMWSWTMVMARHGLAVFQAVFPSSILLAKLLQYTHLPSLTMATIVTSMWNLVIGPVIYVFFMKTAEKKRKFLGYFTSFRLTQIHVFLIFYAVLNSMSVSSIREFDLSDLWITMMITYCYMLLYLFVLDRIGVHMYPIFSPRTHWCLVVWSGIWFLHVAIYWMWKRLLKSEQL